MTASPHLKNFSSKIVGDINECDFLDIKWSVSTFRIAV